jgi:hypothetical protein
MHKHTKIDSKLKLYKIALCSYNFGKLNILHDVLQEYVYSILTIRNTILTRYVELCKPVDYIINGNSWLL